MYAGELVEEGTVFEIFDQPAHPYSKALLSALPRSHKSEGRIAAISGTVPRIMDKAGHCRFHNRCPRARDACRETSPAFIQLTETHRVRCHPGGI